jgi:hypothetical protein
MKMVWLLCVHHTDLRWLVKDIAWDRLPKGRPEGNGEGTYNGCRGLHYIGRVDGTYVPECKCPLSDLRETVDGVKTQGGP